MITAFVLIKAVADHIADLGPQLAAIDTASDWLSHQRAIWEARLDRFEAFLASQPQSHPQESPDD